MLLLQETFKRQQHTNILSEVEGRPGGRLFHAEPQVFTFWGLWELKALKQSKRVPLSWDDMTLVFSREVTPYKQNSKCRQVLPECNGTLTPAGQTFLRKKKLCFQKFLLELGAGKTYVCWWSEWLFWSEKEKLHISPFAWLPGNTSPNQYSTL